MWVIIEALVATIVILAAGFIYSLASIFKLVYNVYWLYPNANLENLTKDKRIGLAFCNIYRLTFPAFIFRKSNSVLSEKIKEFKESVKHLPHYQQFSLIVLYLAELDNTLVKYPVIVNKIPVDHWKHTGKLPRFRTVNKKEKETPKEFGLSTT